VPSPLRVAAADAAGYARASIDTALGDDGDDTLSAIMTESAEEIDSLTKALLV
jgi:hypothetical protein